jgi:hypothetical protein
MLTLALGIGSATVIFSAIYDLPIDPFPYVDFNRSVTFAIHETARWDRTTSSVGTYIGKC